MKDSVSTVFYFKFSYLKSADCLRKVKSEMKSESSHSYMEAEAETQQYRSGFNQVNIPGYGWIPFSSFEGKIKW